MEKTPIVFILFGQSNAVGHELPMDECDKIKAPLANVYGLKRSLNQSYDNSSLRWDHYISAEMNLGEEQDDTYSLANCAARRWQSLIDSGASLPDLYIVHIAVGAQGVTENYMWYPERPERLIPGVLGTVDISLHPFAVHILTLLRKDMEKRGLKPRYILHWRGGEEETEIPISRLKGVLLPIYERIFSDYRAALGEQIPIVMHRILAEKQAINECPTGEKLESLRYTNEVFEELVKCHSGISIFDPRSFPRFDMSLEHYGIFLEDDVHFTREANEWISEKIVDDLLKIAENNF